MVNKKVREVANSLISYLEKVRDDDISENQDVQRLFCWDSSAINELVVTVLTDYYIPPIILGEENLSDGLVQQYIVDGMQRSTALVMFRYGNYKITSSIENSIIEYQSKKRDENNRVIKDDNGSVIWEHSEFDIKGKTFDELPKELQKKFDDYQIRLAIHQNCTMKEISRLVRRYNNHKSMNNSQKAFTYIDNFARKIRTISQNEFFKNCTSNKDADRKNGVYERCVCESVMIMNYLDKWKKQTKDIAKFLNDNANEENFNRVNDYMERIRAVCGESFKHIFVPKDIAIWVTVFDTFANICVDDDKFAGFIKKVDGEWRDKVVDGNSFATLSEATGTKDKSIIKAKLNLLKSLLKEYLNVTDDIDSQNTNNNSVLDFVKVNVSDGVTDEDIELYETVLDDCVRIDSPLYNAGKSALVALVAYSCLNDKDVELEEWFKNHEYKSGSYSPSDKVNYTFLKRDFDKYISGKTVA